MRLSLSRDTLSLKPSSSLVTASWQDKSVSSDICITAPPPGRPAPSSRAGHRKWALHVPNETLTLDIGIGASPGRPSHWNQPPGLPVHHPHGSAGKIREIRQFAHHVFSSLSDCDPSPYRGGGGGCLRAVTAVGLRIGCFLIIIPSRSARQGISPLYPGSRGAQALVSERSNQSTIKTMFHPPSQALLKH